jgi:hypothetical protein
MNIYEVCANINYLLNIVNKYEYLSSFAAKYLSILKMFLLIIVSQDCSLFLFFQKISFKVRLEFFKKCIFLKEFKSNL